MRVFAIADLHLSTVHPKPMTIFGSRWQGHPEAIWESWAAIIRPDDLVLLPGDLSWAMHLNDALVDLSLLSELPGRKILSRGNHDYWWPTAKKLRAALPSDQWAIVNDAVKIENVVVCGTRGWDTPGYEPLDPEDERLLSRETERLRLSVSSALSLQQPDDVLLMMLHYPPASPPYPDNPIVRLIRETRPYCVLYGHLHNTSPQRSLQWIDDIPTHLVAADALQFQPKLILDTETLS